MLNRTQSGGDRTADRSRRTAALRNLGCKVNAYETEAMEEMLREAGYALVPFDGPADVYVINTCSVTNIADRKSRQMLHRARKMNPSAVVVAAGCYVQTASDKTHLDVDADVIIGNNRKEELVSILEEHFHKRETMDGQCVYPEHSIHVEDINHDKRYETLRIHASGERTRAFIKVQDGCNQFCSYCIIPYARGRVRSRELPDILEEVRTLTAAGVKEIVLTGIHLSSYGLDKVGGGHLEYDEVNKTQREKNEVDRDHTLLCLVESVAKVPGVERIRLGSLEPRIVTEAFAARLRAIPQLCPHFHLSLQSGCDSVLRRMNRKYSAADYEQACKILRAAFDKPAITSDVIVGFPGETEAEFAQTYRYLERIGLYETHIFKYSRREGTRAAAMPEQIPEKIKGERSNMLIALGRRNQAAFVRSWDKEEVQVLFEEVLEEEQELGGEHDYTGYTREYIRVLARSKQDLRNRVVSGRLRVEGENAFLEQIVS